jgi:hypothetical protein
MPSRLTTLQARLFPHGVIDVVRQVALFLVAYGAYRIVRGMIDDPNGAALAFEHGRQLISLERALGLFVEPGVQTFAGRVPGALDVSSWLYLNAQTSVTLGALVYLYVFHNDNFYFVRNTVMVAMGIALFGYILYPTAPPRFFPEWGFLDSVSDFAGVDHADGINALFNPYAAVPSMHVCFALLIGIPLSSLSQRRAARWFWGMYPLLVTFVIVATANHFIADAFLGAVTAGLAAYAANWLARARPTVWAFSRARAGLTA